MPPASPKPPSKSNDHPDPGPAPPDRALAVRGDRLQRAGAPFFIHGFNHWAATTLARDGDRAGWDRLRRDLDALQHLGVNAVRAMAGTEGPDDQPWRVVPSMQPGPRRYDGAGLAGVARLADELRRRDMIGIFALTNFWPWSGGMAQYLAWAGEGDIPYPPPEPGGSWDRYQRYTARFYDHPAAKEALRAHVRSVVTDLADNPAIVWELANEPRALDRGASFRRWVDETARLVKSLAPAQLVTTGSEGSTATPAYAGLDVVADHASPAVDFVTMHLWAQNWGWVHPATLARDFPGALDRATAYIREHVALAARAGKPLLLEEFGFPRDDASFDPRSPTTLRDAYFERIYELAAELGVQGPLCGVMPWAWSGETTPPRPGDLWKRGDPLTGDPPHEHQGWYGVYAHDATVDRIRAWSSR